MCRDFGLTGCEWDTKDGNCWSYVKKVLSPTPVSVDTSPDLCHPFSIVTSQGKKTG